MTCPSETQEEGATWPTANSKINWARHNHGKRTAEQTLEKFLGALMKHTALNQILEEQGLGQFFPREQTEEWKEWYESWRPTQSVGRPKKGDS